MKSEPERVLDRRLVAPREKPRPGRREELPGAQLHARRDAPGRRRALLPLELRGARHRGARRSLERRASDETQFDPKSPYYDPRSTRESPRWMLVDVKLVRKTRLLALDEIRAQPQLADMVILRRGNRLSVTPSRPGSGSTSASSSHAMPGDALTWLTYAGLGVFVGSSRGCWHRRRLDDRPILGSSSSRSGSPRTGDAGSPLGTSLAAIMPATPRAPGRTTPTRGARRHREGLAPASVRRGSPPGPRSRGSPRSRSSSGSYLASSSTSPRRSSSASTRPRSGRCRAGARALFGVARSIGACPGLAPAWAAR